MYLLDRERWSLTLCPSPGPRVQRVREEWCGGRHGVLHPGVPAAAVLLQTLPGGHGEPGDGGEQPVLLLLAGTVHGSLQTQVSTARLPGSGEGP